MDQLVGAAEIADRLGLASPQRVREFMHRYPDSFPRPVKRLIMGNLWNWPSVAAWAKANDRPIKPQAEWRQPDPV